jgi:predicted MFS family arabinose efflux permease
MNMATAASAGDMPETNPPQAMRMAVIAFLMFNIPIGTMWGSWSVLSESAASRLGVGPVEISYAVAGANVTTALFSVLFGILSTRIPLKLLMILGSILSCSGFIVLAATNSYPLFLAAYGLLIGPGAAAAVVLAATLVTRWFRVNRGRTMGFINMPIVVTLVPIISLWGLRSFGIEGTYLTLAAICGISLLANLFVIDRPAEVEAAVEAADGHPKPASGGPSFLTSGRFWALAIGSIASATASIVLTSHLVAMAGTWGYSIAQGTTLLMIQSFIGIAGTLLFGWLGDRLGGPTAMAVLLFNSAILWLLLLLLPLPFWGAALVIGLIGLNAAGALPVLSLALSQVFGPAGFSGAFGFANFLNVPFSVAAVPAAAMVFTRTGSFAGAMLALIAFLALGAVLSFLARIGTTGTAE